MYCFSGLFLDFGNIGCLIMAIQVDIDPDIMLWNNEAGAEHISVHGLITSFVRMGVVFNVDASP